jgi:hypothetical protein
MSDWLDHRRRKVFNAEDQELYLHLGYFLSWFSAVEAYLTLLIAMLTDSKNLENFDLLARGLQPRQKVERLRILAKKYRPFGPNLTALLELFEWESIPLRNDLSHSRLLHAHRPGTFLITTIAPTRRGARLWLLLTGIYCPMQRRLRSGNEANARAQITRWLRLFQAFVEEVCSRA